MRSDANPALFEFTPGRTPLLISFPHSGTFLPADLRGRMTDAARLIPDTDWYVPQLYSFARDIGATTLVATHSRYVVDLNRPANGAPLYPGQHETGVCAVDTFAGKPIYRDAVPDSDEIARRLQAYWLPYHEQLDRAITAMLANHGRCIVWDAHSIRSHVPAFFDGRLPDLNIGTADGRSCSPARLRRIATCLASQNRFSWIANGRFKGGHITRRYGAPDRGIDAIQMEIAQSAYMSEDEIKPFDSVLARDLRAQLRALLEAIL